MPKKKKSAKATVPEWFPTLSNIAPYTTVQVAPEEVEEWLDDLANGYRNPENKNKIDSCFRELFSFQDRHLKSLDKVDWSQYSSHQLIWWAVAEMTLRRAIEVFLPPPYDQLSLSARAWLFLFQLIIIGTAEAEKPQTQHPDPIELARRAVNSGLAGPYARQEIQRRRKQHVGSPVGELLAWRAIDAMNDQDPLLQTLDGEQIIEEIMDKLRACCWKSTEQRVIKVIQDEKLVKKTLTAHLSSEIYETVMKSWGGLEGLDALAQALDGKFHFIPRVVADDVMDRRRLRELFPHLEERNNTYLLDDDSNGIVLVKWQDEERECKPRRITESKLKRTTGRVPVRPATRTREGREFTLSITEEDDSHTSSLNRQADHVLTDFLKHHPEHADGIQLLLSDEPLKRLAKARSVTVQTIINHKKKAKEALKKFAEGNQL